MIIEVLIVDADTAAFYHNRTACGIVICGYTGRVMEHEVAEPVGFKTVRVKQYDAVVDDFGKIFRRAVVAGYDRQRAAGECGKNCAEVDVIIAEFFCNSEIRSKHKNVVV